MEFTIPWSSLLGGMLMGSAGLLLLLFNGKIAGISGILGGLISPGRNDFLWRLLFIIGMIGGGWLSMQILGITFPETYNASTLIILLAGLLVGIGAGVGNGLYQRSWNMRYWASFLSAPLLLPVSSWQ